MAKKKVIIFESVKGAGKTVIISKLKNIFPQSKVYGEDVTLEPVRHIKDKSELIAHYKRVICDIEHSNSILFLLDRFHYTKWPSSDYRSDYFREIEELLLEKFDPQFIFLDISENMILERLTHTENHRKSTGWRMNSDGSTITEEASRDASWQSFFLNHQYKDTLLKSKKVICTDDLHKNVYTSNLHEKVIISFD